ncbi:hypothetical protein LNP74_16590 [Klebsiella pneumoniae subsp. pneumoniae]|nr:hypothetical protein [Klebsiella pneumoniae subsp. pneumoniae]
MDSAISTSEIKEEGGKKFVRMADKFINIDELHIDLIDQVNPFQRAFEILSKAINTDTLRLIQDSIESTRMQMSKEEAIALWPKVQEFVKITIEIQTSILVMGVSVSWLSVLFICVVLHRSRQQILKKRLCKWKIG